MKIVLDSKNAVATVTLAADITQRSMREGQSMIVYLDMSWAEARLLVSILDPVYGMTYSRLYQTNASQILWCMLAVSQT